jgi:hypothetical protein
VIHQKNQRMRTRRMDCRVKPGNDERENDGGCLNIRPDDFRAARRACQKKMAGTSPARRSSAFATHAA